MERYAHTEKTAEIFNRILEEYLDIDSDSKLEALGLEYDDYRYGLWLLIDCLRYYGETATGNERVVKWLRSRGCIVTQHEQTGVWKISLE